MKTHLLTTVIILINISFCFAQKTDPILDSLQVVLEKATTPKQEVTALLNISKRISRTQSIETAQVYIQKAARIAKKTKNKQLIADVLVEEAKTISAKGKHEDAEKLFKQALENYKAVKDLEGEVNALNALGIINKRQGKYLEAVNYLEEAEELLADTLSLKQKAVVYTNLSNAYSNINQFKLAYEKAFKALRIHEAAGEKRKVGILCVNIGSLYISQGDTVKALEFYHKSVDILQKENELMGVFDGYHGIATLYAEQGKYEKATILREKQLQIAEKIGSPEMIFIAKLGIAKQFLSTKKHTKAASIVKGISEDTSNISKANLISYYLLEASIFEENKNYTKAITTTEKAYHIGKSLNNLYKLERILSQLYTLYGIVGEYEKAYKSLAEYKLASDQLNNESNIQELTSQNMQFEFDKKQQLFDLEKEALENKLRVEKLTRWGLFGFALLIGVIALLVFRYYKRQNELLAKDLENKKTIEAQAKQLRIFNTQLEKIVENRTKDLEQANYELRTFNYIASHDIKEPIRVIGGYAGLIFKRLPNDLKEKFGDYFDTIKRSTSQLYTLVEDFAYYSTLSKDEVIKTEPVDLNLLTYNVINNLQESIVKYKGEVIVHHMPTINSRNTLLFTALKNLIENGLKYNKSEKPAVEVSYQETEITEGSGQAHHKIIVSDNGIGIDEKYHSQIFEMFKRLHNRGAYEGSGIGLAIVKLVTEKLGGTVDVDSREKKGSQFIIQLPII